MAGRVQAYLEQFGQGENTVLVPGDIIWMGSAGTRISPPRIFFIFNIKSPLQRPELRNFTLDVSGHCWEEPGPGSIATERIKDGLVIQSPAPPPWHYSKQSSETQFFPSWPLITWSASMSLQRVQVALISHWSILCCRFPHPHSPLAKKAHRVTYS